MSKTTEEKIDEMHDGRGFYEWTRHTLRKIDRFGRDVLKLDTSKKPETPEATGAIKRLKEASDKAARKRDGIFKRMRRGL